MTDTKPELFNCCSHEDPSPLRTSTVAVETEGIDRCGCIEVHTMNVDESHISESVVAHVWLHTVVYEHAPNYHVHGKYPTC